MLQTGFLSFLLICLPIVTYAKLIPLHRHDSYADCLRQDDYHAVYCSAKVYIKPDENAEAWNQILAHSANELHHLRYDRLNRIYCIKGCNERVQAAENSSSLIVARFNIDPEIYRPSPFADSKIIEYREKYDKLINQCVNLELKSYGLKAFSEIDFCLTKQEKKTTWDWLDLSFLALLLLIMGCCFASSVYDILLNQKNDPDHYKKCPKNISPTLIAFSFPRNIQALASPALNKNNFFFEYFEGMRFLAMIVITSVHHSAMITSANIVNPEEFEEKTHSKVFKIFAGGSFTIQIFFTLTGFLLTLPVAKTIRQGKVLPWSDLFFSLKNRILRYYPLLLFVLLSEMTIVRKISEGPVWMQLVGYEYSYCRKNWWTNLLFINNFVRVDEICLLQSKSPQLIAIYFY